MERKNSRVSEGQGHSITHDLVIDVPIAKIFEAITEPEHLINWWPLRCKKTGDEYNFYFTPDYDWYGKAVKLVKNESFYIKMTESDEDWDFTTFGFDLERKEKSALVKFWHIGWPECNAHFRRSSFCWAMLLNGLKNYLEKGIIVPFEERE